MDAMGSRRHRAVGLLVTGVGLWLLLRQTRAVGTHLHAASLLFAEGHVSHPAVVQSWVQLLLLAVFTLVVAAGALLVLYGDWHPAFEGG